MAATGVHTLTHACWVECVPTGHRNKLEGRRYEQECQRKDRWKEIRRKEPEDRWWQRKQECYIQTFHPLWNIITKKRRKQLSHQTSRCHDDENSEKLMLGKRVSTNKCFVGDCGRKENLPFLSWPKATSSQTKMISRPKQDTRVGEMKALFGNSKNILNSADGTGRSALVKCDGVLKRVKTTQWNYWNNLLVDEHGRVCWSNTPPYQPNDSNTDQNSDFCKSIRLVLYYWLHLTFIFTNFLHRNI